LPNILLTQRCVRSCPYCFAKKHMSESSPDDILSWENLVYLADLLEASNERQFRILGGEPTLHPDFNHMVLYLLERNFNVIVFTSGIMVERTLLEAHYLFKDLPFERLAFICNINDPQKSNSPLAEVESVKRFLKLFENRVIPSFNIYRTDFELEFLFHYMNEFGLQRSIRLGMAHPILGKRNIFIRLNDVEAVIKRLFTYTPLFERLRVKIGLDCGFPLCRFSDEQLAWLYRFTGGESNFGCAPAIDIGPDMTVWPCFPLSSFQKRSIFGFNCLKEIQDYYVDIFNKVKVEAAGIFQQCDDCVFRQDNICRGGCLAHNLARFQNEAPVRMKEVYS